MGMTVIENFQPVIANEWKHNLTENWVSRPQVCMRKMDCDQVSFAG